MCKLFVNLIGDLEVVLGRWGGGGPQLGGLVGCPLQGPCYLVLVIFHVAERLVQRVPHPLKVGASALVHNAFGIDFFAFCSIFKL